LLDLIQHPATAIKHLEHSNLLQQR